MKKVALITLHGMGKIKENYYADLEDGLKKRLGDDWTKISFQNVQYAPVLQKEQKKLFKESPKEEMYDRNNTKKYEVYTKNNVIASNPKDASELKKILLEWDRSNKEREPINRDPKDLFTLANGTKIFPYKDQKNVQEIDESTLNAMKQLGYIDGE